MTAAEYRGRGSVARLGPVLDSARCRAVFLVTGKSSYAGSGAKAALEPFLASIRVVHFDEFSRNPTSEDVRRGVEKFREAAADYISKRRSFSGPGLAMVAIPTTAGTGAEATHFATIYLDGVKHSAIDGHMLPAHAILDADLTMSVPPAITAATGIDALAQGIESYWSVNATDGSRGHAREAVQRAAGALAEAVAENTEISRDEMMIAANLAGKAINVSRTTAPHALSYKLTSDFGVPHGHAVGLTLGTVFAFNSRVADDDATHPAGAEFTRARIAELCELLDCADAAAARDRLQGLMTSIGLETRLSRLGVARSDLPALAGAVNEERLLNNPRRLPPAAIASILETIY